MQSLKAVLGNSLKDYDVMLAIGKLNNKSRDADWF